MDFQIEQLIQKALEDSYFRALCEKNNITRELIDKHNLSICSYIIKKEKCNNCRSIRECKQEILGYQPILDDYLEIGFEPCKFMQNAYTVVSRMLNLKMLACSIEDIKDNDLIQNEERTEVLKRMIDIYRKTKEGNYQKGLFISGPYGCGKSYICSYFARLYATLGKKVVFAYYPDLVRNMKQSITNGGLEETVETLKSAEVLFLDDFGGEVNSPYIRDEVLGSVLQERMVCKKLTFMTSNLEEEMIVPHLAESGQGIDNLKASRIDERIHALMDFITLKDKNYRRL